MTSTANAVGAPVEIKLAGKTYLMSPLSDEDYGTFERWMRSQAIATAKENLDGLSPADREILLKCAYEKASRLSITSPDALPYMASRDGAARLTWLGLLHRHPGMTLEEVKTLLADQQTINDAMDKIDEVNRLDDEKTSKKKTGKKKIQKAIDATLKSTKASSTGGLPSNTDGTQTPSSA